MTYEEETGRLYYNGAYIGDIIPHEGGGVYFFPEITSCGGWPHYLLEEVAAFMRKLEEPFKKSVEEYFKENPPPPYAEDKDPFLG